MILSTSYSESLGVVEIGAVHARQAFDSETL